MRGVLLIAAALLLGLGATRAAEPTWVSKTSTTTLINNCNADAGNELAADCAGYILGVFDALSITQLICPPANPSGLSQQAVAVGLKHLRDHPERWNLHPSFLLVESFTAAFPCRNPK